MKNRSHFHNFHNLLQVWLFTIASLIRLHKSSYYLSEKQQRKQNMCNFQKSHAIQIYNTLTDADFEN